jgi:hypothetical protein
MKRAQHLDVVEEEEGLEGTTLDRLCGTPDGVGQLDP